MKDLENGIHFWALMDKELVAMGKFQDKYYVCGGWECGIPEDEFEFLEIINFPKNYSSRHLYYNYQEKYKKE